MCKHKDIQHLNITGEWFIFCNDCNKKIAKVEDEPEYLEEFAEKFKKYMDKPKKVRQYYQSNPSETITIDIQNISSLRQYLNESNEPATNGIILYFLTGNEHYIIQHEEEKANIEEVMEQIAANTFKDINLKK